MYSPSLFVTDCAVWIFVMAYTGLMFALFMDIDSCHNV